MDTLLMYESPLINKGEKKDSTLPIDDAAILLELNPAQELSFDLTEYISNSNNLNLLSSDTSGADRLEGQTRAGGTDQTITTVGVSFPPESDSYMPQYEQIEQLTSLPEDAGTTSWEATTIKEEHFGPGSCVVADDQVGFAASPHLNLGSPTVSSSSSVPGLDTALQALSPVPSPSDRKTGGGKAKSSRKRSAEKGSDEYLEKRARNNVAVRKSRAKAKERQKETEGRVKELSDENDQLQKKVELLTKELNVLKGLFINVGAALPADFAKLLES